MLPHHLRLWVFLVAVATAGIAGRARVTAATAGSAHAATGADSLTTLASPASPAIRASAASGDHQSAVAGTDFAGPLVVVLRDGDGNPVAGATVTFDAPAGRATGILSASSVASDAAGHARITVHAGTVAGSYTITATTPGPPVRFTMTNRPDAAVALTVDPTSSPQRAAVGDAYPAALTARVADQFGNGVAGATVAFAAPGAGASGTLSAPTDISDATGRARVTILGNATAGSFAVTASTAGIATPASFALENLSGAARRVTVHGGSQQAAAVNTEFGAPLVARVEDASGNPVAGAVVEFRVPASGPTATPSSATLMTDASGDAILPITAGTIAGSYQATAQTDLGAAPIAFSLTNTPGAPASASAAAASSPQTTRAGHPFAAPLAVTVVDAFGNPVGGVDVAFTAPAHDPRAVLSATTVTTRADGTAIAPAVAGPTIGRYQVSATIAGLVAPVSFTLANGAGSAASLVSVSGAGQRARASTAFAQPLVLRVVDAAGTPVAGATVRLATPARGPSGSLSARAAISSGDGLISVALIAGTTPGNFAVFASTDAVTAPIHIAATVDPIPTVTAITAPAEPAVGHAVTATVKVTAASHVATGQVELYDATGTLVGDGALDATGTAQVPITVRLRGHRAITARYRAQAAFAASESPRFDVDSPADRDRLTGASADCSAGPGRGGLGFTAVLGALLVARSRRRLAVRRTSGPAHGH